MIKKAFLLALLAAVCNASASNHWAVLVAGSDTWWNYRHQSDVCHAYQLAKGNGIPEDQIIVIMRDDIAKNSRNPFPGQIFNQPDGQDVYAGCKIDYSGDHANPEVLLAVLKGEESKVAGKGTGKVLKSTANDNVFFYYSDHGSKGLVAMPDGVLYATDFNDAL